ncbi:MAG: PilN domain-containing protein [Deltaproteobacteria bacterium]|nr:PilN domain-containing protein [Deltaproteobacteria bacterium]
MIRVNLLPFRDARKKENVRRQLSIYILSVIFLFALLGFFFINLNNTLAELTDKRNEKQRELATYQAITKRIKEIERKNKELVTKLDVIRDLEASKTGPVRLLEELAAAIPENKLWLTSLVEKGGSLDLKGTAMDNDTVALFMTNLQKAAHIQSVDLTTTKLKTVSKQKINVIDFVLKAKTTLKKEKTKTHKKTSGKPARRAR